MSWFARNSKTLKIAAGLIAGTGVAAYVVSESDSRRPHKTEEQLQLKEIISYPSSKLPANKVLAGYTTNFEPTQKWDNNWDRRDPKTLVKPLKENADEKEKQDYQNELKKVTPTATRHLFLIRHGQYNLSGETDTDRYLSKLGREQAELTGKRLKELGHPYTVMINSTMTRAVETADIIAQYLPEVPRESSDLIREGAPYPPEPPIGNWRPEAYYFVDGSRIESGFRKFFHRAEVSQKEASYEVIPCHANVIRYYVCRALQFPPEGWLRMGLYHGSITYIVVRPSGRVGMRSLGDAGHMPPDKVTSV